MDAERGTAHRARLDYSPDRASSTIDQGAEKGQQLVAEAVPFEGEADIRLEVAGDLAGVVIVALELERDHLAAGDRAPDRVSELDLAALPGLGRVEGRENVVGENVAAEDGEVGRGFADRRLLDQVGDPMPPASARLRGDDAVAVDLLRGHPASGEQRRAIMAVDVDQLLQAGSRAEVEVVREQQRAGLVVD